MAPGGGAEGYDARLRAEGLDPGAWGNGPGDRYSPHEHGYDKVIVVTSGSITFGLPGLGTSIVLSAGDRLELPAGTQHDGLVGSTGVRCLEAHLPSGALRAPRRIATGEWQGRRWPPGFAAWLVEGRAEVVAPDGKVIGRSDEVTPSLGGPRSATINSGPAFGICSVGQQSYR